jgi:hypothetical protein
MGEEDDPALTQALAAYEERFSTPTNEPIPESQLFQRHTDALAAAQAACGSTDDADRAQQISDAICIWKQHHIAQHNVWASLDQTPGKLKFFSISEAASGKLVELFQRNWKRIVEQSSETWNKVRRCSFSCVSCVSCALWEWV